MRNALDMAKLPPTEMAILRQHFLKQLINPQLPADLSYKAKGLVKLYLALDSKE